MTEFQRTSLVGFDDFGLGVLVVLFKKSKLCYAITARAAFDCCAELGRKSLTEDICDDLGVQLPKEKSVYDITKLNQLL